MHLKDLITVTRDFSPNQVLLVESFKKNSFDHLHKSEFDKNVILNF